LDGGVSRSFCAHPHRVKASVVLAFAAVAWLSILTPGPAVFLALRNGAGGGVRAAIWSSLGNVSGIFLLSAAATLGLGALLMSSARLFGFAKLLGAGYLFYLAPFAQNGLRAIS